MFEKPIKSDDSTKKDYTSTSAAKANLESKSKEEKKTKIVVKIPIVRANPVAVNRIKSRAIATPSSSSTSTTRTRLTTKITPSESANALLKRTNLRDEKTRKLQTFKPVPATSAGKVSNKPNAVLDTIQNVTVSSPPTQRKQQKCEAKDENLETCKVESISRTRTRTRTRTLDREEIVVLKNELAPQSVKGAVAFEINFDEPKRKTIESDSDSYEDDFESYESDFEAETSSTADELKNDATTTPEEQSSVSEDESELTHFPITVVQRDTESERKLDSGNFDMKTKTKLITPAGQNLDISDRLSVGNLEQLDSGISYSNASTSETIDSATEIVYAGYAKFFSKPIITAQGLDTIERIQFDLITFKLFEQKPISYDIFMRTYGRLNSCQVSVQTNENRMTTESQTDECSFRSKWTQHPPQNDFSQILRLQICCGELVDDNDVQKSDQNDCDLFECSIRALNDLRQKQNDRSRLVKTQRHRQLLSTTNFERLNIFLMNSSLLIAKILNLQQNCHSNSFVILAAQFLNALRVVRIFANPRSNIILTVHESIAGAGDVYRSDFANLMMVWTTSETSKPIRLLSSWSEICRAEICNESLDIIVAGLRDGSIAMWDLRETYSHCSKLDGHLTHFAATQSIVPVSSTCDKKGIIDFGAVVDVKSFREGQKAIGSERMSSHLSIQFASLNDTGILTVWTLIKTANKTLDTIPPTQMTSDTNFEYSSPWARVKLIQSAICDLRECFELPHFKNQTKFERTKTLFQKNIFNDKVLRELNSQLTKNDKSCEGLRFTSIDTGCDQIYICTNRNFILVCSRTLKTERFRKISIDDTRFLFPTALRVLTNEDYLAVGLSNGSVIILNYNQSKPTAIQGEFETVDQSSDRQEEENGDYDLEFGKSCAIQNIIRKERPHKREHYSRPNTATYVTMIAQKKKPFEMRIFDQQILLNGTVLRKNLVQSIELSSDGWRLFAISDGEVRTYDFCMEKEISSFDAARKYRDMGIAKGENNEKQIVILLNDNNEVHLHALT